MTTLAAPSNWFRRAEQWLDGYGKPAWIATMVLGFILFWPIGLALLAYMIWGKHMFKSSYRTSRAIGFAGQSSGNSAFDAYKADTLRRLEDEQAAFDAFLTRLREAKDKAEFDQFMADNRKRHESEGQAAPSLD
ncbi:DUF2852 domain-containing protein [Roseibaca sp. V10]|uniref:DUF2852 domain-containing protein n=1 Tax=Roseinatronobacter domitianus TaxID=2940293 RepID=A0ABT0M342_9RHOB|nr:DUF2852 domain-containing protein [Roseibaca domitiana]MCL1629282.1 DUF2852 domain-containing protein [Roseibaca domitiana]